jgi:large repetitive protein
VNLSLNSQSTTFSERAPWNDVNTLIDAGYQLPNMMDMNSQRTGINFNVIRNFTSFNDQLGLSTGHNTGVVPDTVMKTFYYNSNGDTAIVSFSGLSLTGVYNIGFYAGTNFSGTPTVSIFKIGNQTVSLNAFNNTTNMVFINGVKPDSTGTVYITFFCDAATGYAMLNSLTIQAMPSPDVIGADSLGTSGIIATALANNGLNGTGAAILGLASAIQPVSTTIQGLNTSLGAYPNPFVDNVTVSMDFKQDVSKFTVVLVDVAGRIVQRNEFDHAPAGRWQQTINLSNLPRGSYFMQVMGVFGESVKSFKLVKIK